ncbi:hypothetical protein BGW80DRAFT_367455 [Lactifluus volemus]|nr:hypothetical protein BGW80DRAFT_367455 [Lactifluus volemus]
MIVVYGARPGGALLGKPGACIGVFAVSAALHDLGLWGLGRGIEFRTTSTFFLLMGVGIVFEFAFKRLTGWRMGACLAVAEKTCPLCPQRSHPHISALSFRTWIDVALGCCSVRSRQHLAIGCVLEAFGRQLMY